MFGNFLPENYEAPKQLGNYLKLQDGDTKIRILSKPIVGWEDWDERSPVRFRMDAKPTSAIDPKKPLRHFWTMVVFNYNEDKIQVFHITQASIIREIGQLVQDTDWGNPANYDIKINRSGKEMRTKYSVKPMPHKPVTLDIIEAFNAKPCYLEAMFDNGDPFSESWGELTQGIFEESPKREITGVITNNQIKQLLEMIGDDKEYMEKLEANLLKHFAIKSLKDLPESKYEALHKSVKLHSDERLAKEMAKRIDDSLPF